MYGREQRNEVGVEVKERIAAPCFISARLQPRSKPDSRKWSGPFVCAQKRGDQTRKPVKP